MREKHQIENTGTCEDPLILIVRLLKRVGAVHGETGTVIEALERLLGDLSTYSPWCAAAYYDVDLRSEFGRCRLKVWRSETSEVGETFFTSQFGRHSEPIESLEILIDNRSPSYRADLQTQDRLRGELAARTGLRSSVAFPVMRGGRVQGVIELLSYRVHEPKPEILETLAECGQQLGAFLDLLRLRDELENETSAKRCLESSFELMNTIIENAPAGFAFVDPEFRYVRVNEALARINRTPIAAHIGRTIKDVVPNTWKQVEGFFLQVRETGAPLLNRELRRPNPDKPSVDSHLLANYFPVHDKQGLLLGIGAVVVDITEKKTAQEDLKKIAADLQKSNAALEEFGYVVSHDLKEPLRMINSYLKLLNARSRDWMDPECQDYISFASKGARRMSKMVDDLLRFSRLGGQNIEMASQSCSEVLDEALENVRDRLEEEKVTVTADPLPEVRADRIQLMQVFQNLICNAVKFRSERPVQVHVSFKTFGNEYLFSVRDNGQGIDASMLDQIFDVFQKAHGDKNTPGEGIGLAVCRRIIESHGGRIWAESQQDRGSVFHFTLSKS